MATRARGALGTGLGTMGPSLKVVLTSLSPGRILCESSGLAGLDPAALGYQSRMPRHLIADGVPEIARRKSLPARTLFGARGDRVTKGRYSKRNATIYYATPPGGIDRLFGTSATIPAKTGDCGRPVAYNGDCGRAVRLEPGILEGCDPSSPRNSISWVCPNTWPPIPDEEAKPAAYRASRTVYGSSSVFITGPDSI